MKLSIVLVLGLVLAFSLRSSEYQSCTVHTTNIHEHVGKDCDPDEVMTGAHKISPPTIVCASLDVTCAF